MPQEIINLSTNSFAASGDTIRSAFIKCNNNFAEIYSVFPDDFAGNTEFQVINLSNGIGTVDGDTVREAFIKINNNFTVLWTDFQSNAGVTLSGNTLANAQLVVNVGVGADTQTSDTVFDAFTKVNGNFSNLYAILGLGTTSETNTAYGQVSTRTINLYLQSTAGNVTANANLVASSGQQIIDTGDGPDTQTGDTVYSAFIKINENFTQLYTFFGNDGVSVNANVIQSNSIVANGNIVAANLFAYDYVVTNGNVVASAFLFPNGQPYAPVSQSDWGNITSSLIPNANAVYSIGTNSYVFANAYLGNSLFLNGANIAYSGGNL